MEQRAAALKGGPFFLSRLGWRSFAGEDPPQRFDGARNAPISDVRRSQLEGRAERNQHVQEPKDREGIDVIAGVRGDRTGVAVSFQ